MAREYIFGSGQLFYVPAAGGTPLRFGTLQDVSVEFQGDIKELHGQFGFPVAAARGKEKVAIKAGNGDMDVDLYNATFFGEVSGATGISTGSYAQAIDEAGSVPAMSAYAITVAHNMTWYRDLGVVDTVTGEQLKQVASGPATGEYTVASGVYTFNAAQASLAVKINYIYTVSTGRTLVMNNHLIGTQPVFELNLMETYNSQWMMMQFNQVICGKLNQPLKLDDFSLADLEMSAFVDNNNVLGIMSTSTAILGL